METKSVTCPFCAHSHKYPLSCYYPHVGTFQDVQCVNCNKWMSFSILSRFIAAATAISAIGVAVLVYSFVFHPVLVYFSAKLEFLARLAYAAAAGSVSIWLSAHANMRLGSLVPFKENGKRT